jgi:hypothetical protein
MISHATIVSAASTGFAVEDRNSPDASPDASWTLEIEAA